MSMNTAAVRRLDMQSAEHAAHSANSLAHWDVPLSELSGELRAGIADFRFPSWFGSLSFCESYAYPPVQNVAFCTNPLAEIQEVIFFNKQRRTGLFKEMEIVGQVDPKSELLLELRAKYQPDLIRLSVQFASKFPEKIDDWRLIEVRRINEDYCIDLPATPEEYLQSLGKQTRKHLPYYLRRLQRECQESVVIQTSSGEQISRQAVTSILVLNQLRMRSKGRETLWTRESSLHRWPLIQKSGMFFALQIGEKLAGGTLSFLHGGEAFLITIAHDPQYDRLNIGSICLWQTIEHLIRLGCRAFHLLWGASFYKAQFGGQLAPIYRVTYARNVPAAAACWLSRFLKTEQVASLPRKISRWLGGRSVPIREWFQS